jgi:hypothetical protein
MKTMLEFISGLDDGVGTRVSNGKVKFVPEEAMKARGGVTINSTLSLTSAVGVGDQDHAPAALPPGKKPGTHFVGG